MRRSFVISLLFLLAGTIGIGLAQEGAMLTVQQMDFCTGIQDREPVGIDTVFSDDVGTVYCFTKIDGATDTTTVSHVWYYKGEEKARVTLNIKGDSWRTWSSKTILKEWDGKWRVDVESASGSILQSKDFVIKPTD